MKLAVLKENMQGLFNAVVVQAADDYREATVTLMEKPDDKNALAMLEDCRSFFLSEDFCFFTSIPGADILHRLERASLKDMSRQAKRQWKQLFRLERRDKKMMQDFENWRRELKWQKIAS